MGHGVQGLDGVYAIRLEHQFARAGDNGGSPNSP